MDSEKILIELLTIVRERLSRYGQVAISELGIFKVISQPSSSELLSEDKFLVHPPKKNIVLESNPLTPTDTTLISGLASSLGISHESSKKTIDIFLQELLSQLPVTIPDFGMFKQSNNELQFTADPKLIDHVVGIYAKMTPIKIEKSTMPSHMDKNTSIITSKERTPWPAIFIPLALIIAIVGYFFVRSIIGDQENSESPDLNQAVVTEGNDPTLPIDESEQSEDVLSSPERPTNISTLNTPSESNEGPTNVFDRQSGGYTLIIASFDSPDPALSVMERYREIYPLLPVDTLIGSGKRHHRVAIGQFTSIPQALALKERLNEIPEDSWVLNILNKDL